MENFIEIPEDAPMPAVKAGDSIPLVLTRDGKDTEVIASVTRVDGQRIYLLDSHVDIH